MIAMIIANDYLDRDEARERASSNATRVAMNHSVFGRKEDRDGQLIFEHESKRSPTQGDLHGQIDEIDQKDVCKSELVHGNEDCQTS